MRLEVLDAGHWVHAERPMETVKLVEEFLKGIGESDWMCLVGILMIDA